MNCAVDRTPPHFLLLEPYYGGSHRFFLKGMRKHVPFTFTLISLPARKWKMRMQLAAPLFAERVIEQVRSGISFDGILCSTFLDSAMLKTLLCRENIQLPLLVYFHENQFAYPNQLSDPGGYQFAALNFTSAIAADRLAFNSRYNLNTFILGVEAYLKKAADMKMMHLLDGLQSKAEVLYPGIDFKQIDRQERTGQNDIPVIVWNHRWEHDKDPETFFQVLYQLADQGIDFELIILGQGFAQKPAVFDQARIRLQKQIIHFGYVKNREEYVRLLLRGDIVISTAKHEFFGIAVLEAVRCGCFPIVPDRLAYCELFPQRYRYREGTFKSFLKRKLLHFEPLAGKDSRILTEKYSWASLADSYQSWLASVV
ncbi:MAG: DUF3524 domain-containing protein [Desulfobulbaceae bacterium]|nr:DUF3524 domain-containing protein [Desulfobulbaceae bacterium]